MRHLFHTALLTLLFLTTISAELQQVDQTAATLWELAVAAKGGRDRLAAIDSFAIQLTTKFKRATLPEIAVGKIDQIVCTLPDGWWEFLDYGPGLMGRSVHVVNARTGLGWASHGGDGRPLLRPDTFTPFRMRQMQYVFFLQTRAVQPVPLRASRIVVGSRAIDRVETDVNGDAVIFDLDVSTHLPVRVETIHKITAKPPRPDSKWSGELRYVYELDDYNDVSGIRVPRRVLMGNDPTDVRIEINPNYDPSIFDKPPSGETTIDSWRGQPEPTTP